MSIDGLQHESAATGIQRLRDTRREILGSVCLEHLLSKDETPNALPVDRFVRAIKLKNYGGSDPLATLEQLANDTGLFAWERKGETMRFLHLTLREFLAAAEVVERGNQSWEKLLSVLRSDTAPQDRRTGRILGGATLKRSWHLLPDWLQGHYGNAYSKTSLNSKTHT